MGGNPAFVSMGCQKGGNGCSTIDTMDAAAELGRNPVSKHQIQPEYGDEQTDAGRDCRTRLARPNSQARTRTGKYSFFPVQLTTCRIGNLTRLIHTLAICDDHTYIHTV